MTRWLLWLIPVNMIYLFCYITNPIVCLFADEAGELKSFLHLWQTWDDSCDSEYYMKNVVPEFLDYGYDEHYVSYIDTDEWSAKYNKTRHFSILRQGASWTTKQRIQRYFCRVLWLARNCAYGWMFYCFGADLSGLEWDVNEPGKFYGKTEKSFCYKNEQAICSFLRWKVYLGWKSYPNNDSPQRCMYANRFLIAWRKNGI